MSYARKLCRHLDTDLIDRLESSGKPEKREPVKTSRITRPGGSYRGARRNEARFARNGGARVPMITYAELLRINQIAASRRA